MCVSHACNHFHDTSHARHSSSFLLLQQQITTDRATYDAATGRKVAANIIQSATGVIEGGNTCGVAYLNSLGWRPNTVWVSCNCGLSAIPQIIA